MSNGYMFTDEIKDNGGISATAGTTVLTGIFKISGEDSRNILVNGYEENRWRNGRRYQARRTFHVRTPYFIRNLLRI